MSRSGSYNLEMAQVVFLRGINVGGFRSFRPTMLARELENYGVINIGAAGTFVVCKPQTHARMLHEFRHRLPFDTEIMICSGRELIEAAAGNPIDRLKPNPNLVRFVSVLKRTPRDMPAIPLQVPRKGNWLVRVLSVRGRLLFGVYRREMKAISCLSEIDKLFGSPATTRSWSTICAVVKILERSAQEGG